MPDYPWMVRQMSLVFNVGDLHLHTVAFRSWVIEPALQPLAQAPGAILNEAPRDVRALVFLGQPVTEAAAPRRLTMQGGCLRYVPFRYRRSYIDLQGTFAQYLQKFSARSRGNRVREVRRFRALGGSTLAWREFRRPEEMATFHRLACEVSRRTYQNLLFDGGMDETGGFRAQLAEAAAADRIRGYILFHGEAPVAFNFCRATGDVLNGELMGFDPAYRKYRPGGVLLYLMLERLFSGDRFRRFDFGQGDGHQYKEYYSTGSYPCVDVYYFRRRLAEFALLGSHAAFSATRTLIGRSLARLGAKERVRRRLERRIAR
jgi:CelD/BcsL family acetyltransferase involved in cellulose biosynthesis